MQIKTTIRFFTIADYEKEQEYIFALLFGILICLYLLVCKNICKLLSRRHPFKGWLGSLGITP